MWEKQAKAEEAAKAALVAKEAARKAMTEARLGGKDSSDEHSDDGGDSVHACSHHQATAPTTPAAEFPGVEINGFNIPGESLPRHPS